MGIFPFDFPEEETAIKGPCFDSYERKGQDRFELNVGFASAGEARLRHGGAKNFFFGIAQLKDLFQAIENIYIIQYNMYLKSYCM